MQRASRHRTVRYPGKVEGRLARGALVGLPNHGIKSTPVYGACFLPKACRSLTGGRLSFSALLVMPVSTAFGHAEARRGARDLFSARSLEPAVPRSLHA